MRRGLIAAALVLIMSACGLSLSGTATSSDAGRDGGTPSDDGTVRVDQADGQISYGDDAAALDDAGAQAAADTSAADVGVDASPPCPFACGANCVADCSSCTGLTFACGKTCVETCDSCSAGKYACYTCEHRLFSPPVVHDKCAPLDGTNYCPDPLARCSCSSEADCNGPDEVCVTIPLVNAKVCASCGESGTSGKDCKSGGKCTNVGGRFVCQ